MNVFKKNKLITRFFSLIELLIVVAIIGALVALILPHMEGNEQEARDTACDYNNYGTLRYITMFKSVNGVYPSGFHTGLASNGDGVASVENMAGFTAANMAGNVSTDDSLVVDDGENNMYHAAVSNTTALTAPFVNSLKNAGIVKLYYGTGTSTTGIAPTATSSYVVELTASSNAWQEDQELTADGEGNATITTAGDEVTIEGSTMDGILDTSSDVIIPLFVTPTIDWDSYYDSNGNEAGESTIKIALAGQCPNLAKGAFRYYICMFRLYSDGSAAKLLGTLCPECGSVNP